MDIILYLLQLIQYLYQQNCWLINFICRYIPLKQWAFDDSHSPKYQKFKVDELPKVQIIQHEWHWQLLLSLSYMEASPLPPYSAPPLTHTDRFSYQLSTPHCLSTTHTD